MSRIRIRKGIWAMSLVVFVLFSVTKVIYAENNAQTQQPQIVTGKVSDPNGDKFPGVSVVVKGTTVGTLTDQDGHYSIDLPPNAKALIFSFVGMKTSEVQINERTVIDVTLVEDIIGLDELVVLGYMSQKKADLTGSVAVVSSSDVSNTSNASILKSLQGKIPGMVITTDGNPNDNVEVSIRGLTSFRAAPPLIVIDGLPSNINLKDLNSQDIESIQILKDAASASIYGSRAASGVILITTKLGKVGEQTITYNGTFGIATHLNPVELLNTEQYGQALWQACINDGLDPNINTQIYSFDWHTEADGTPVLDKVTPREYLNADNTMKSADTDWLKEGTRAGIQQNHQLTISNGTDKAKTMFSVNYFENQGTQIYTYFKRYSTRLNSEYNLIKNILTIGENLYLAKEKIVDLSFMHGLLVMPSIIPVRTVDGIGWGGSAYGLGMDDYDNPLRRAYMTKDNLDNYFKLLGSVYANIRLLKNLNFKTQLGIDYSNYNHNWLFPKWTEAGGASDPQNYVDARSTKGYTRIWTNTLTYNLDADVHQLNFLAGIEALHYYTENLRGTRLDILLEDYDYAYLNSATGTQTVTGSGDEYALMSYFSKFNYVYDSRYLLSATLRYDGSSKFGKNNRFGFFPAVSAGWRISEESFFNNLGIISDLKLRASWGKNGNSNIPTNALVNYYDASYAATAYAIEGNESGALASGYRRIHMGNSDLKWETTTQTDIGLDFGLWNNYFSGSLDFYYKITSGMLFEPGYLSAIGEGGAMWINAADMTNKGVEIQLNYSSNPNKDFTYSISANIASNINKINDLPDEVRFDFGGNGFGDDIIGRPLNSFYGFVTDGLFTTQEEVNNSPEQPGKAIGRIKYKDLDNDGRITTQYDRTWIGVADPDFMYGINFNTNYKNFDFSMFWQGIWGNTVNNAWKTYSDFWNIWTQMGFNHPTRVLDAWSQTNKNSTIPALSMSNPNDERRLSTYFTESGAYLKLRNIELGYTLPENIASKLSIQNIRIYMLAQNVINVYKWWGNDKYTGGDPEGAQAGEYALPYVIPSYFRFGVNATF